MNKRDATFTGKVSEWGLLDGTVLIDKRENKWMVQYDCSSIREINSPLSCNTLITICEYKIKSLPDGYEFNEAGEIVKAEAKRYWNGKEALEVGMIVLDDAYNDAESTVMLIGGKRDSEVVISNNETKKFMIRHPASLMPIDTRTDKEKAVDEVLKSTKDFDLNCVIEYCYDKWVGKDD